ncbi:hypothetical protein ASE66_12780 [Bosea sp. Root483D1]|uniref:hypothetical protein n=1 Tax=Bosea sp. Root483D1 TaxID=1736544 RepID=UPI000708F9C9|nr:hypothetical protein [Bosea sp. Root483D1]KRE14266.1 hypothetical protein ASE66_12780 [Bosea sp. Root483D1]
MLKHAAVALAVSGLLSPALAADLPSRKGASVAPPVLSACTESEGIPTDAFGFTTGSDVAEVGSFGASLTYGGGFGVRDGRQAAHGLQLQGSYGRFPCFEIGPYLLGGYTDATIADTKADSRSAGAGVEMKYRLLGRDLHGIGLTIVVDPSFNRTDPTGAGNFTTYNTGIRLFADKTLIPGKLYAALNLSQDLTWTGPSPYLRSSTFTVGGSLAWQLIDGLYLSGEVRHQRRHNDLGFGKEAGYATFAGPGIFWQASKQLAISAAYNIQVAGKAKGVPGDLDVTNFSQHVLKVKAAYSF